ncbi:hypothetical protein OWV82_014644 [Melia azedarach]|uniref:Uncharacterized protein n=1 Tax=Melia azedarach TaxID=155640 RepID=A0ACC1XQ07_MELAZ|nr:hypothetical protein OWV82_014644 [Melia azedarach]
MSTCSNEIIFHYLAPVRRGDSQHSPLASVVIVYLKHSLVDEYPVILREDTTIRQTGLKIISCIILSTIMARRDSISCNSVAKHLVNSDIYPQMTLRSPRVCSLSTVFDVLIQKRFWFPEVADSSISVGRTSPNPQPSFSVQSENR